MEKARFPFPSNVVLRTAPITGRCFLIGPGRKGRGHSLGDGDGLRPTLTSGDGPRLNATFFAVSSQSDDWAMMLNFDGAMTLTPWLDLEQEENAR